MHFLANYGLFLLKLISIVIGILVVIAGIVAISSKGKEKTKGKLCIEHLNEKYKTYKTLMAAALHDKLLLAKDKKSKKSKTKEKSRVFVLNFHGDMRASAVSSLAEEITAILLIAKPKDEVMLRLESVGGVVHGYGLAASQLQRIKNAKLKLTIAIDKVAASGGYMMACVADHIIAAPFAIIGSIGVVVQLPNFHRYLQKKDIDFEQLTAGQFKRTLTLFGENTGEAKEKLQQEINETHALFKDHIKKNREHLDIEKVASGEHWYGTDALALNLIDALNTSDDYLLKASQHHDLYEIHYKTKKPFNLLTKILQKLYVTPTFS